MARGHPVAQVERAQQRGEQRDLEAGELAGAQLELVGAVLGDEQGADEVLEDQDDDAEQGDRRGPDLDVGERRTPSASIAAASSDGSSGRSARRTLVGKLRALDVARVAGDQDEVDREREDEDREDQQVEADGRRCSIPSASETPWKTIPAISGNQA